MQVFVWSGRKTFAFAEIGLITCVYALESGRKTFAFGEIGLVYIPMFEEFTHIVDSTTCSAVLNEPFFTVLPPALPFLNLFCLPKEEDYLVKFG